MTLQLTTLNNKYHSNIRTQIISKMPSEQNAYWKESEKSDTRRKFFIGM